MLAGRGVEGAVAQPALPVNEGVPGADPPGGGGERLLGGQRGVAGAHQLRAFDLR